MPPFDASVAVLVIMAVLFAGMGIYALVAPARLIAPFGVGLASVTARSEVRAVYGGFGVAIAAVLIVALMRHDLRPGIAVTVSAALAGMALGRMTSLLDGASPLTRTGSTAASKRPAPRSSTSPPDTRRTHELDR